MVCSCVSCVSCDVPFRHTCARSEEIRGREKAPLAMKPEGQFPVLNGARGIRTPKPFRALAFEASAIPFCQRSSKTDAPPPPKGDGKRSDSCLLSISRSSRARKPAWNLKSSIGAPGFEPGTSASRTQRSTGLSHAPKKKRRPLPGAEEADGVGFEPTRQGCCPHALQACALNHSATRPNVTSPGAPRRG